MPTKANGPLMEDYIRALRAAKRMGAKAIRVEIGKSALAIILDDTYLERLAPSQHPAPDADKPAEERVHLDW